KCERSLWPYLVLDLPPPSSVRPLLGSGEHAARYREAVGLGVGVGVALGLAFGEVVAPRPARAAACALEICSCILAMFCAYAARSPLRSAACACAWNCCACFRSAITCALTEPPDPPPPGAAGPDVPVNTCASASCRLPPYPTG